LYEKTARLRESSDVAVPLSSRLGDFVGGLPVGGFVGELVGGFDGAFVLVDFGAFVGELVGGFVGAFVFEDFGAFLSDILVEGSVDGDLVCDPEGAAEGDILPRPGA
jgi:hypothetical protein